MCHVHRLRVLSVLSAKGDSSLTTNPNEQAEGIRNKLIGIRDYTPVTISLDDLYLPHAELNRIASNNPDNPLLQQRGQPGTHDVNLGLDIFRKLKARESNVRIPRYDKSAHNGKGDRVPGEDWKVANGPDGNMQGTSTESQKADKVDLIIFEGWCLGFRALSEADLFSKYEQAKADLAQESKKSLAEKDSTEEEKKKGRLGRQKLEDLIMINDSLKAYEQFAE